MLKITMWWDLRNIIETQDSSAGKKWGRNKIKIGKYYKVN